MSIAILLSLCSTFAFDAIAAESAGMTPEALVQRGIANYRVEHYADAATDLNAAAQALLSQEQMQNYVNTGKFPNMDRLETALVYLALTQAKLGNDDQAREAVLRLMTAERIETAYAQLPLAADAAGFESLAARLVPGTTLPANVQLARGGAPASTPIATGTVAEAAPTGPGPGTTPPPATTTATSTSAPAVTQIATATPPPAPQPSVAAPAPPPPPPSPAPTPAPVQTAQATTTGGKLAVEPTIANERADRQRIIDEIVAQERARIQKAADERIASERAASQRAADERIASERANIQKAADERIAAERAAIQRAADERIAEAQKAAEAQVVAIQAQNRRNYLLSLRQADANAANNKVDQANQIYEAVVNSQDAPREMVAEAAVGLYRTGAFRDAANAFRKLAPYSHGEEDLRYYNAVSLYETGDYAGAKKELACALPFIQVTADVSRYQTKIEQTPSQQASR
jgi:hypothetical protein